MAPTNQKGENIVDSCIPPTWGTQSYPWLLMSNKRIFTYNKEWLVTVDYKTGECDLLNFMSMEKVKLPEYNKFHLLWMCCYLTSPPGDPNCHVVFIESVNPCDVSVCQLGDDNFIKKEIMIPKEVKKLTCITFFNGSMYAVGENTLSLLRANLNDPTLEFETVFSGGSMQNMLLSDNAHGYLIESCGELLLVMRHHLRYDISDFQIFRADFSCLEWEHITNIGDRAIFLDELSTQGYSCSASESGIQENCIYYTEEKNRLHYIFNLENGSFTSTMPCPTFDSKNVAQHWVLLPPPCCHSKS